LLPNGPDSGQLPLWSATNTASESSQSIGLESQSFRMLPRLLKTPCQSDGWSSRLKSLSKMGSSGTLAQEVASGFIDRRLSPVGSLASLTQLRADVRRLLMSVTCGENAPESLGSFARDGASLRMYPVSYQVKMDGSLEAFSGTWFRWGIAWGGGFGELTTLGQFTRGIGSSLWRSPNSTDARDRGNLSNPSVQRRALMGKQIMLSQIVSTEPGEMNPVWVERLMGFPAGWTEVGSMESQERLEECQTTSSGCEHSETPSSPSKPIQSSKP